MAMCDTLTQASRGGRFTMRRHKRPRMLWRARRTLSALAVAVLLAGLVWIGVSASLPGTTAVSGIPAPQAGFVAPDFSLPDQNGADVTLSDFQGQAVLVNIWASWCSPCRQVWASCPSSRPGPPATVRVRDRGRPQQVPGRCRFRRSGPLGAAHVHWHGAARGGTASCRSGRQ